MEVESERVPFHTKIIFIFLSSFNTPWVQMFLVFYLSSCRVGKILVFGKKRDVYFSDSFLREKT
jgi:hypothetical protein